MDPFHEARTAGNPASWMCARGEAAKFARRRLMTSRAWRSCFSALSGLLESMTSICRSVLELPSLTDRVQAVIRDFLRFWVWAGTNPSGTEMAIGPTMMGFAAWAWSVAAWAWGAAAWGSGAAVGESK